MPDIEKVIKGLECCAKDDCSINDNCPYGEEDPDNCLERLSADSLALLNELKNDRLEFIERLARYFVEVDGNTVAKDMTLKDATIFIRALFEEYWNDKKLFVSIRRMDWDEA